jgi:hypothetical protein
MIDLPNQAACSPSIMDWTVLEWSCRVFVNRDDFYSSRHRAFNPSLE